VPSLVLPMARLACAVAGTASWQPFFCGLIARPKLGLRNLFSQRKYFRHPLPQFVF
jgi:hypothetical protein